VLGLDLVGRFLPGILFLGLVLLDAFLGLAPAVVGAAEVEDLPLRLDGHVPLGEFGTPGAVVIGAAYVETAAAARVVVVGADLREKAASGDIGVLSGHLDELLGDFQVRAVLVGLVQAIFEGNGKRRLRQFTLVVNFRVKGKYEQGVESGLLRGHGVAGLKQLILGSGQIDLGLEHVEPGFEADVVKRGRDLELRGEPGDGVLGAAHAFAGLEHVQKVFLHREDEREFDVGEIGLGPGLVQRGFLIRGQGFEAVEEFLVDVEHELKDIIIFLQ